MSEHKIIERLLDDLVTRVEALEEKADEIWVPVKDHWNYFISNKGRVKHYQGEVCKFWLNNRLGYYQAKLNGNLFYLHRLLAKAFIPNPENKPEVDHIDGNRLNNDLSNLRWCTRVENARNTRIRSDNTSGFKGVSFYSTRGKYRARIKQQNGREKHLGYFETAEAASEAYEAAARELYGEFFCTRR